MKNTYVEECFNQYLMELTGGQFIYEFDETADSKNKHTVTVFGTYNKIFDSTYFVTAESKKEAFRSAVSYIVSKV